MCGRYASSRRPEDLVEEFQVDVFAGEGPGRDVVTPVQEGQEGQDEARPGLANYNTAPTVVAPVVLERVPRPAEQAGETEDEEREPADPPEPVRWLRGLTWGLVPSWAKDRAIGNRMINARADSLFEKPAFRRAVTRRRCLVPADGWYEWQKSPTETDAKGKPRKQPFYTRLADGGGLAFAGLYELWRDPDRHPDDPDAWLATYVIITTDAEPGLDVIHDRMPVVLPPERWDAWLDPANQDPDAIRELLAPVPPGRFEALAVSTRVNNVRNNGPELVEPLALEELRGVVDPATGELIGAGDQPLF